MKYWFRLFVCFSLIAGILSGCTLREPEETVDPKQDPRLHIEHFDRMISLYGTERIEALRILGYELSDTTFESWHYIEIPQKANICDIDFSIFLRFEDLKDQDECLFGTQYLKAYDYPEEKDKAIQDVLALGEYLAEKLGEPDEVDTWNDYLEERSGIELDETIPAYQSAEQLEKLLEYRGGDIMLWDLSGYAPASLVEHRTEEGWDVILQMWLSFAIWDDAIQLEISF